MRIRGLHILEYSFGPVIEVKNSLRYIMLSWGGGNNPQHNYARVSLLY